MIYITELQQIFNIIQLKNVAFLRMTKAIAAIFSGVFFARAGEVSNTTAVICEIYIT